MEEQRFLALAEQIMPLPTTTFHERFVSRAVEAFVAAQPAIELSRDPYGNLFLLYDARTSRSRRGQYLVATAHLDHPGLAYRARISDRDFFFEKLGGVDLDLACRTGVRIYHLDRPPDQKPVKATIAGFLHQENRRPPGFAVRVRARDASAIGPGSFAMWDVKPLQRRGRRLHGRACDDLAGVTVGLSYLDELVRRRTEVRAGLLLTRAEEIGFGGMVAAVRGHHLDLRALYINIECSSIRAGAVLGDGPIIRVGDAWWIFDPRVSGGMVVLAEDMARTDPHFCFQRKLMDGGMCEATVLMNDGFSTGAVALPLKNYHNSGKKRLRPEVIHLDDALGLVDLLVHLAAYPGGISGALSTASKALDKSMTQRYHRSARRLAKTCD